MTDYYERDGRDKDEDSNWREVVSDEDSQGDGDKSGEDGDDEGDLVESSDDGEKSDAEPENEDRDVEPEAAARRSKAKRKREKPEVEEDNEETQRKRKKKTNVEEEDDIVERFEFEIEDSVAAWFDEFKINRNSIPESSDEEEDPIIIRDRRIRMGIDDKLAIGRTFFTAFEIKEAVLHHALKSRENIRQERYGKEKIGFRCGRDKNCGWKVYCAFDKSKQLWVLRTKCGYHSCTPNGKCKLLKSPVIWY